MAGEEARRPYDLARGPLLRPLAGSASPSITTAFTWPSTHLLFDGVSLYRIILPELVALYDRFSAGEEPSLPEPPIQYADYSALSREHGSRSATSPGESTIGASASTARPRSNCPLTIHARRVSGSAAPFSACASRKSWPMACVR